MVPLVFPEVFGLRVPVDGLGEPPGFPVCPTTGSAKIESKAIVAKRQKVEVDIFSSFIYMPLDASGSNCEPGEYRNPREMFNMALIIRPIYRCRVKCLRYSQLLFSRLYNLCDRLTRELSVQSPPNTKRIIVF